MKHSGETDKLEKLCLIDESESEELWSCSAGAAGASASSGAAVGESKSEEIWSCSAGAAGASASSGAASCEACNGACGGAYGGACSGEQPQEMFVKEDGAAAASASAGGAGARDSRLDASKDVKGCFHRDVKLENIIVTGDFDTKIMDYGSLKFTDEFNGKTFTPWQGMFVCFEPRTQSLLSSFCFQRIALRGYVLAEAGRGFTRLC
jgi:hypothetical protein